MDLIDEFHVRWILGVELPDTVSSQEMESRVTRGASTLGCSKV